MAAGTLAVVGTVERGPRAPAEGTGGETRRTEVVSVHGLDFERLATDRQRGCDPPHAVGEIEAFLSEYGCEDLRRSSLRTTVDGSPVAVSVAAVSFADDADTTAFRDLAETPGTGTFADPAAEGDRWPGDTPDFADAAFRTALRDHTVMLVLADTPDDASTANGQAAVRAAEAALAVPLEG